MKKIIVKTKDNAIEVYGYYGEKLADILKRSDIKLSMPCNGIGSCGKCKIRVLNGDIDVTEKGYNFFSDDEIKNGMRLACQCIVKEDVTIELLEESGFRIVSEYKSIDEAEFNFFDFGYGINIDIGTTTICFELLELETGKVTDSFSMTNSQRKYGADVISRITAANMGDREVLCNILRTDLLYGIKKLTEKFDASLLNRITVAGNTTMIYLFLNKDCRDIGQYPFNMTFKALEMFNFDKIFGDNEYTCPVVVLPCISAFVGADVVSGAIALDIINKKNTMLIDIGTNGEIILNANGKLYCTSVAAGPAFEGGNISCGVGGVEGAVSSAVYNGDCFDIKTIGDKKPIGICGSGLIDIIAELIKNNIVDNTGLLADEFFENGVTVFEGVKITQEDIRQYQLAKGALRAGIECIVSKVGIDYSDIQRVFIAGGFGFYINMENTFVTGMLPKEFKDKIEVVGNSCLYGMKKLLNDREGICDRIATETENINLSTDEQFNEKFIEYLNF